MPWPCLGPCLMRTRCSTCQLSVCSVPQASLEKKLRAANLQKRNAERSNELSAVMREVRLLHVLLAQLQWCEACRRMLQENICACSGNPLGRLCHESGFEGTDVVQCAGMSSVEIFLQAELQKLEKKLADALDALKVEQASNERANRRAALDQHRLEQVLVACAVLHGHMH